MVPLDLWSRSRAGQTPPFPSCRFLISSAWAIAASPEAEEAVQHDDEEAYQATRARRPGELIVAAGLSAYYAFPMRTDMTAQLETTDAGTVCWPQ